MRILRAVAKADLGLFQALSGAMNKLPTVVVPWGKVVEKGWCVMHRSLAILSGLVRACSGAVQGLFKA